MPSIREFKKEIIETYGALLDECFFNQLFNQNADKKKLSELESEIEQHFDDTYKVIIAHKGVENKKSYMKQARDKYIKSLGELVEKFNALV